MLRTQFMVLGLVGACALVVVGCKNEQSSRPKTAPTAVKAAPTSGKKMPAGHPAVAGEGAAQGKMGAKGAAPSGGSVSGKVLETMDSAGYTYAKLQTTNGPVWVAVRQTKVKVGEPMTVTGASLMQGFTSKTLGRTFDKIYFGMHANVGGGAGAANAAKPADAKAAQRTKSKKVAIDKPIPKAEGDTGHTVAEIHTNKDALSGKTVSVRGKVSKFNAGIMGKNWLHLQDGTSTEGHIDITVTTQDTAKVGDVVLVKGTLATDKDFGAGYKYDAIIEKAKIEK